MYVFKSNTAELAERARKRLAQLREAWNPHEKLWLEIRDNFCPDLGLGIDGETDEARAAKRGDEQILNSEPKVLVERLSAGLMSGITNQAQRWFALAVVDKELRKLSAVRRWQTAATDVVLEMMSSSNCYSFLDLVYQHIGCFGSAAGVTTDAEGRVHHEIVDAGHYYLAQDRSGRVHEMCRRIMMTPAQMAEEFGLGWLPDEVQDAVARGDVRPREVYNWIVPLDDDLKGLLRGDLDRAMRYAAVYFLAAGRGAHDGVLAIRGHWHNPIVAPRWAPSGGVYGHGPGKKGLGDAKQLQRLERDKLLAIKDQVQPTVQAPAGLRGMSALDSYPGGVVWAPDQRLPDGTVRRLFETRVDLSGIQMVIQEVSGRLSRIFYADLFSMLLQLNVQKPKDMTAREVAELSAEKVALLGPILTRLNTDLLDPLVTSYVEIALRNGLMPEMPPELAGEQLTITYVSALHTEMLRQSKSRGLNHAVESVAMVARLKPEALDKLDADATIDEAVSQIPEAAAVILDEKAVAKLREARAQAAEEERRREMLAQAGPPMARAARDLGETRMGTGSALDMMAQAAPEMAERMGAMQ